MAKPPKRKKKRFLGPQAPEPPAERDHHECQKEGLDTNGLMKKIKSQARSFDRSQSESAVLVDSTLAQVEEVRKLKGSFSADEWNTVRAGPLAAAALVIEAAPSKDKRTVEEAAAAVASVGEAGTGFATTSLMATLFHDGVADLAVEGISDPMSKAKAGLALVQRVALGEAETYKKSFWMRYTQQRKQPKKVAS